MRKSAWTGYLSVLASAVIFGFTPVLAALSYQGGNNGVNMAFLRALLPIPLLAALALRHKRPRAAQLRMGVLLGLLSFGCTLLLYSSYGFIPVGLATALHFLYPMYVVIYEACFQKKGLSWQRACGLALGLAGVLTLLDGSGLGLDPRGIACALLSGVCYAGYIIVLGREAGEPMPLFQLMLVISVTGVLLCGGFGLLTARLTVALTGKVWLYAACVALLTAVVACVLFQTGVRVIGEANSAIFSLLEPVTSILFGVLLIGDAMSPRKWLGCGIILSGLLVITLFPGTKAARRAPTAREP